jgi:hypothetical protein
MISVPRAYGGARAISPGITTWILAVKYWWQHEMSQLAE